LYLILIVSVHELSHVLVALCVSFKITGMGISLLPVPHFHVSVISHGGLKQTLFILSGLIIELSFFAVLLCFEFFSSPALYYALSLQILIDSNPFYSDALFAIEKDAAYYTGPIQENPYLFSKNWYLLLTAWFILIIVLIIIKQNISL
jgi:hypothetical protein